MGVRKRGVNQKLYIHKKKEINEHDAAKFGPRYLSRYSDSLQAGRSGYRIPVRATFTAPVQTGTGAHPASSAMGTGSLSRG